MLANGLRPAPAPASPYIAKPNDDRFVTVNPLKSNAQAEYSHRADSGLAGRDVYARDIDAQAKPMFNHGAEIRCWGKVSGLLSVEVEGLSDAPAPTQHPSLAARVAVATSAEDRAVEHRNSAGVAG